MDFSLLIAAFGGGLLATMIGGLNSFIFTGLTVIAAIMGGKFGAPAIGLISFGPMFGPQVAFAGAVAGAAYAMTKNHIENGQDIVTPLIKFGDPMVLIVGGIFGMIGFLVRYLVADLLGPLLFSGILGTGGAAWTDTIALTVVIAAIITRLVFGKTGLTGKTPAGEKRSWVAPGPRAGLLTTMGLGIGVVFGGTVVSLGTLGLVGGNADATYLFGMMPILAFGISAFSLIFIDMGYKFEAWHHIAYPAASTAVIIFTATLNPVAAMVGCVVTAILTAFIGDWAGRTFNSFADTHIDPPAVTIFIMQLINLLILGGLIIPAMF